MKALLISADHADAGETNSSAYRVLIPGKYLSLAGHNIAYATCGMTDRRSGGGWKKFDQIDYSNIPEVVLLERLATPERIQKLRAAGAKRIVVTFDDHYGLMPNSLSGHGTWHGNDNLYHRFLQALDLVDLVIVPSRALEREFSKHASGRIACIPNFIDPDMYALPRVANNPLIIGWGGSAAHAESWERAGLAKVLKEVQDRYGNRIRYVFCGRVADAFLETEGVDFESLGYVDFYTWPLIQSQFDIGLAPVAGKYGSYRSNLKTVEYGVLGIPFVASRFTPYEESPSPGGRFAKNSSEWYDALEELIEGPTIRKDCAQLGKSWSEQYWMSLNVKVYEDLLWG